MINKNFSDTTKVNHVSIVTCTQSRNYDFPLNKHNFRLMTVHTRIEFFLKKKKRKKESLHLIFAETLLTIE